MDDSVVSVVELSNLFFPTSLICRVLLLLFRVSVPYPWRGRLYSLCSDECSVLRFLIAIRPTYKDHTVHCAVGGSQSCNFSMYRNSSYSFLGNFSFLNLEIQRSQYINVRKLFKGGNYSRVEII